MIEIIKTPEFWLSVFMVGVPIGIVFAKLVDMGDSFTKKVSGLIATAFIFGVFWFGMSRLIDTGIFTEIREEFSAFRGHFPF